MCIAHSPRCATDSWQQGEGGATGDVAEASAEAPQRNQGQQGQQEEGGWRRCLRGAVRYSEKCMPGMSTPSTPPDSPQQQNSLNRMFTSQFIYPAVSPGSIRATRPKWRPCCECMPVAPIYRQKQAITTAHRPLEMETSGPLPHAPRHRRHRVRHSPTNTSDHAGPPHPPPARHRVSCVSGRGPPRGLASRQTWLRQRRTVRSRSSYPDDASFPSTTEHA
jgi:hypothetical protein